MKKFMFLTTLTFLTQAMTLTDSFTKDLQERRIIGKPEIKFTGYKFTDKESVSGSFKEVQWSFPQKSKNISEQINNTSVIIKALSIDAGNEARNTNIIAGLFKAWKDPYIQVSVSKYFPEDNYLVAMLSMGSKKQEVIFQIHQINDKTLSLTSTIDLLNFGLKKEFLKLSEICGPLHTGADGVAKTWSNIDLEVVAQIK